MNRAVQRKMPVPAAIPPTAIPQRAHTPGIMVGASPPRVPMVHSALNDFDMAGENLWQVIRDLESKLDCVMMPAGGAKQGGAKQLSPTMPPLVERITGMGPYVEGEDISGISISAADADNGSPKLGDMIARNPQNHDDKWLVAKKYFEDNFEEA